MAAQAQNWVFSFHVMKGIKDTHFSRATEVIQKKYTQIWNVYNFDDEKKVKESAKMSNSCDYKSAETVTYC